MKAYTAFLFAPLFLLPFALAQRTCYFSDGTIADGYSACNNSTEHSGCCRLYQTNGTPVDLCTTNGLCLGRSGVWNGFFFQSGCTDSTWQSSDCPKACSALATPESNVVQPCNASSGGLWCCRADGTGDCCGSAKAIAIGQLILPVSLTTSSSSSSSSATASPTSSTTTLSTITAAANCTANSTSAHSQPQVNTATIGIGASLGAAFLATLGMLVWREWSWRKRPVASFVKEDEGNSSVSFSDAGKVELHATGERPSVYHELGRYGHDHQELEGLNHNRF